MAKAKQTGRKLLDLTFSNVPLAPVTPRGLPSMAYRSDQPFAVATVNAVERGQPGDYLVVHPDGQRHVMRAKAFEERYLLVDLGPEVDVVVTRRAPEDLPIFPIKPNPLALMARGGCKKGLTAEGSWDLILRYFRTLPAGQWADPREVGALRPDIDCREQWAKYRCGQLASGLPHYPHRLESSLAWPGLRWRLIRCEVCQQEEPCCCYPVAVREA